jgi:hypothetical protein
VQLSQGIHHISVPLRQACSSHGVFISLGFQILEEKNGFGENLPIPNRMLRNRPKTAIQKAIFQDTTAWRYYAGVPESTFVELNPCKTGWPYGMMRTLPLLHSHSPLLCRTPRLTSKPRTSNTVQPSPPHSCPCARLRQELGLLRSNRLSLNL